MRAKVIAGIKFVKERKRIFKKIALAVAVFTIAYVSALVTVKNVVAGRIEKAIGLKTTIRSLNILPPFNIEVGGFEIEGLIKAERIRLAPSIRSLLSGRLAFNKIVIGAPEFTYQRNPPPVVPGGQEASETEKPVKKPDPVPGKEQPKIFPIEVKNLKVYSGKMNFFDTTSPSGKISVLIRDINFYITNLSTFGAKGRSNFDFKARLSWNTGEPDGTIALSGWADLHQKDISANLKIENIDAIVFYPYYSTWVDLEKARIEKARLKFNCDIKGKDNDIAADCHLELVDIVRRVRPVEEPQQKAERLTDAVLDMFKAMNQGRVVLDFTLHTKMDRPEFGFSNIKSAFEGKLMQARTSAGLRPQDVLIWPGRWVKSGLKSGADLSSALVDGIFDLGNGIKRFFEDKVNTSSPAQE